MDSPLLLAQQIFSAIRDANVDSAPSSQDSIVCSGQVDVNATNSFASHPTPSTTHSPTPSSAILNDLPSLILFFFSFSALRDWIKILVFGSIFETLRRFAFYMYRTAYDSFFITATFEEEDASYDWVCYWLSRQPTWRTARDIQISTESFGLDSVAVMIEGESESDDPMAIVHGGRQLAYLPALNIVHSMWYKGHWVRVTRFSKDGFYGRKENHLEIRILTRSHDILNTLLIEAKKAHRKAQENLVGVYISDSSNTWRHIASRQKRPLNSIILDPGIKDLLIDDARDFLGSKSWYAARGIPFRRGYLLYGAPGSGKTSIIHSLAGELGLDVYMVSLSRTGLDDTTLNELISDLPEKCIALMEDIDAALSQTLNRETGTKFEDEESTDDEDRERSRRNNPSNPPLQDPNSNSKTTRSMSKVTLSGLLNALDGLAAQEGRILFATTNKYDSLDPALCRPGRMDIHLEFKLASRNQAKELFRCFYIPDSEGENKGSDEDGCVDSGYCSDTEEKTAKRVKSGLDSSSLISRHQGSIKRFNELATEFAEAIPEREFSMASLQGYLMGYKVRPVEAVKDASAWVEKERRERREREKKGKV